MADWGREGRADSRGLGKGQISRPLWNTWALEMGSHLLEGNKVESQESTLLVTRPLFKRIVFNNIQGKSISLQDSKSIHLFFLEDSEWKGQNTERETSMGRDF